MNLLRFVLAVTIFLSIQSYAQNASKPSLWRAEVVRRDGNNIVFNFEKKVKGAKTVIYIQNGAERLRVDSIRFKNDSVFIKMPVFESALKARVLGNKWNGVWIKGTSGNEQVTPFFAEKSRLRFPLTDGPAKINIAGRWAVKLGSDTSEHGSSIAEFRHRGNRVTGSFLTPFGDYRFLEGVVTGNNLKVSAFDGAHAVLFTGVIENDSTIADGKFISGATYSEPWTAVKNAGASVKLDESAMYLKPGEERLNFTLPDIDGKPVSINDARFKNKVVIVQLMGSWCPNCMDETEFLSEYYNKNRQRGIEVVALAYEYSTSFKRSQASLRKFQNRFNIKYPILITGVTVSDSLRTEKTLPQVTPIKVFPSSIILDKYGKVRRLDNSFAGPGTGEHFEAFKRDFNEFIDKLLAEK